MGLAVEYQSRLRNIKLIEGGVVMDMWMSCLAV